MPTANPQQSLINIHPTGKLSFSWPRSSGQEPINTGDASYDPPIPYGYGLSYHACNYQLSWCTIESVGCE